MISKIEGLILSKVPFQDRHLICHLLLRNGKKVSVTFYGGKGGGKKKKSSILELGTMIKVELSRSKSTSDLYSAKEWDALWRHENIRENHKAFYTLCFFLEIIQKIAIEDNLHDRDPSMDQEGLFRVLSNACFFLERSTKNNFYPFFDLTLFLAKLMVSEGMFPQTDRCILTDDEVATNQPARLLSDQGGFAKAEAINQEESFQYPIETHLKLRQFLSMASQKKYLEIEGNNSLDSNVFKLMNDYALYQLQLTKSEIKTLPMLT